METVIKLSISNWINIGKKAGWLKTSSNYHYFPAEEFMERMKSLGWKKTGQNVSHMYFLAPNGMRIMLSINNWDRHWRLKKKDLRNELKKFTGGEEVATDLDFLFDTPFEIPPNYNFKTCRLEKKKFRYELKQTVFNSLAKYDLKDIEIQIKGQWLKPEIIDFSTFEIAFNNEDVYQFKPNSVITIRYLISYFE